MLQVMTGRLTIVLKNKLCRRRGRTKTELQAKTGRLTILTSLRFFEVSSTKLDIQIKEDEMQKEKYDLI